MMVNLPIDEDAFDAIVCAHLRASIKRLRDHGDDPKDDKKLIAAMKLLIRHYGGTTD